MIAVSSSASLSSGCTDVSRISLCAAINSNQKALSSASSSTIPILAMNSARERARQAAR